MSLEASLRLWVCLASHEQVCGLCAHVASSWVLDRPYQAMVTTFPLILLKLSPPHTATDDYGVAGTYPHFPSFFWILETGWA